MKRLKGGPDLKMPELKVPDFLADLYFDLRDRRLLPLVGLAIVAIVAVPFLLGGSSAETLPPASPGASAGALGAPAAERSTLTVVEAKPGLRDYRKRLRAQAAADPFEQRYTAPDLTGTKLGSGDEASSSSSSSSSTTTTKTTIKTSDDTTTTTTTKTDDDPTEPSAGGGASEPQMSLYSFAIDVKITHTASTPDGGKKQTPPEIRKRVLPASPLPSAKTQVVTFMGLSPKTGAPLLLVSDAVTAVFGEAKCLSGTEFCQLLEVPLGLPMTFVFGPDDDRYKLNVLNIEPVRVGQS